MVMVAQDIKVCLFIGKMMTDYYVEQDNGIVSQLDCFYLCSNEPQSSHIIY
jgi:hypothetical protein